MTKAVRTRIAPSPTGFAHIGTAYTALINHAAARHYKGKFVIRIEDSDLKRNIKGAEQKIYEALEWLGISWDEGETKGGDFGPYKLSERLELYKQKAAELVKAGKAYEDEGAIRFKNPGEEVGWKDLIRGDISFPGAEITDFVMIKADGYPTYNFNVVVDDMAMEISHVVRGEDHISNTPRQIALYRAFGATLPEFAHHPLLVNNEKKKLSKRDAAVDVMAYKNMGYLPEAFANFLALQGWSHPEEKEIFDLDEFAKEFTIERMRPSGAMFDIKRLDWINGEYIRRLTANDLTLKIYEFFEGKYSKDLIEKIVPLVQSRIKTLKEFEDLGGFFFKYRKVDSSFYGKGYKNHIKGAIQSLESLEVWDKEGVDKVLLSLIDKSGFKTGDFFMDLRVAITGQRQTPPINDSILILGKNQTIDRLNRAVD